MKLSRAYKFDAGADIHFEYPFTLAPYEMKRINLCGSFKIDHDEMGLIIPRSSTLNEGIIICSPAIDCGYDGDIHVWLYNTTDNEFNFKKGDRICSIVVIKIRTLYSIKPQKVGRRGNNKFGSSGLDNYGKNND